MAAKPRYQIRSPQGQAMTVSGTGASPAGLYEEIADAVAACQDLNASGDPVYQYVIVPVIHAAA